MKYLKAVLSRFFCSCTCSHSDRIQVPHHKLSEIGYHVYVVLGGYYQTGMSKEELSEYISAFIDRKNVDAGLERLRQFGALDESDPQVIKLKNIELDDTYID